MISKTFVAFFTMIIVALYIILPHKYHQFTEYSIKTIHGNVDLLLEEARNNLSRNRGLMWRKHLQSKHGMVFIFDKEERVSFWMKDTFIPLDIIFFNAEGYVVYIKTNTIPNDTTHINPPMLCKYVIELNAGEVSKYGIKVGDYLNIAGNTKH